MQRIYRCFFKQPNSVLCMARQIIVCPTLSSYNWPCTTPFLCVLLYLASERDTIRGVKIRADAVYVYIYIGMEVRVPQ